MAVSDRFYLTSSATKSVYICAPASLAMEQDKSDSSCCSTEKEYVHEWLFGGSCLPAITFSHSQYFNDTDTAPLKKSDFKLTAKLINLQRHAERKVP